jgi:hypothetical protein
VLKGEVLDEEKEANEKAGDNCLTSNEAVPKYWLNKVAEDKNNFDQMVYVNSNFHKTFDDMLSKSYKPTATQDRLCPKASDQCAKTPGGCPCVRPGGTPGLPTGYVVRRVIRVEDSAMWQRYLKRRDEIQEKRKGDGSLKKIDPPVLTDEIARANTQVFEGLDSSLERSEVYLWHGTAVRTALAIAQNDFNIDLAGSSAGTMYGRGAYLAESCTKADEYSKDEQGGYYEGIFALLLVRVCLGKYYHTTTRDNEAGNKVASGDFDSTLGDRSASVNTFREFVVYNADQLYPEYIVLYSRVHASDNETALREHAKTPFHMELPVYWTNCHCNPHNEQFEVQYRVRRATAAILQRLVSAASKKCAFELKVVEARRCEDSEMWNRYVDFKRALGVRQQASLVTSGDLKTSSASSSQVRSSRCIPPNELDGNPDSGHALTTILLEELDAEDTISLENLDATVNEMLLWHGTNKESAEAISWDGFHIPRGERARHGKRFGEGAYFAEELDKSMSYAQEDDEGLYYVLLCRTTCGEFYYTEENVESNAHSAAQEKGKDSVLANPKKEGPREFIVMQECQVYPEFILHLRKE